MEDSPLTTRGSGSRPTSRRSPISFGIIAHGGVGSPKTFSTGCKKACDAGYKKLSDGEHALDAVVEAVRLLEDDGRFNAGSGSTLRLDGTTVEMDAAVMDCRGRIGSVITIRDIKNPILAARCVLDTPHVALSGRGASLFARLQGLPPSSQASPASRRRYRRLRKLIEEGRLGEYDQRWDHQSLDALWNFDTPFHDVFPHDTVGAVALDREGRFATAVSTGGASPMLLGRVGDVPFVGCGYYAGKVGAVAVTGIGEEIVRKMLSRAVYDRIMSGAELKAACREALDLFPENVPIGIIAITRYQWVIMSNRRMASARSLLRGKCSWPDHSSPSETQPRP